MTARGTALLVGVSGLLAAYIWLAEVRPRRIARPPMQETEAAPLLAAPARDVGQVVLDENGHRLMALRRDGGWSDAEGHPWSGDAVSDLVDTLSGLRPLMVVDPDPAEPADYGLGPDAPRLGVSTRDGRPLLALEVGERNPAWTGLYARLAGRPEVVLVGAVLRWELEKLRDAAPQP